MNISYKDKKKEKIPHQESVIAITATFTAEPLEKPLSFWMGELQSNFKIEFAPYNQIFQQLLDPSSLLRLNKEGINIVLLRFEDWQKSEFDRNLADLTLALKAATANSATPYIVCICPSSPQVTSDETEKFLEMENTLRGELGAISNLYILGNREQDTYPVADYYDAQRDRLGHIPFTPLMFTSLATLLARRIYAIKSKPYKVLVLDCDNTIWKGVVGEDGVTGIEIPPAWKGFQEFVIAQQQAGMLICLCSKNNEPDVLEVFEKRSDMPLKIEQIVSWRINWLPKSENIKSLARELNLGLDSFIFIDDNPVECAEVQANCPEVLSLTLPIQGDIVRFVQHIWAFDRLRATEEDRQRTMLYKQNLEREQFLQKAPSMEEFLAGLQLKIDIFEPEKEQLERVAQLTQRTNQFNLTTIRRSESDIQQLSQNGLYCRAVSVSDRFGDYGLVGVMIFSLTEPALRVETFLLSCRVLGRGVEHRMLRYLAEIAQEKELRSLDFSYIPTKKNLPALNFLESVAGDFKQTEGDGYCFSLPLEIALDLNWKPGQDNPESDAQTSTAPKAVTIESGQQANLSRIASELWDAQKILYLVESAPQNLERQLSHPVTPPRTEAQKWLVELWKKLLGTETLGIDDNYFDLGGTSLLAVEVFAEIEKRWDKKLPLTTLLEAPTIEQLAMLLEDSQSIAVRESLVLLHNGEAQPPLFLVHDGDGETLLYLNLARSLKPERPVYGIQPYSKEGYAIMHTRITDMAAYYIEKIRTLQPQGPYLLGGMCAGGVIAFEMARQLQQRGEKVALVALIDAADVEAPKQVGLATSRRWKSFSESLQQKGEITQQQRLTYLLNTIARKVTNLLVYESRTKIQNFFNQSKMKLFRYYLDQGLALPPFLKGITVRTAYLFAEAEYTPGEVYQGEVVLLRATVGEGADEPYINLYSDPLLGWGQRVTQEVKVYDIPGGHSSMLQPPNVEVMAEKLQIYIDSALSAQPVAEIAAIIS